MTPFQRHDLIARMAAHPRASIRAQAERMRVVDALQAMEERGQRLNEMLATGARVTVECEITVPAGGAMVTRYALGDATTANSHGLTLIGMSARTSQP